MTLDLGRTFGVDSMNRRARARARSRPTSSRSSSSPRTRIRARYRRNLSRRQTAGVGRRPPSTASPPPSNRPPARSQPAAIGAGEGEVFIGHNRRYVQPDGTVKMLWRNATKTPTHPLDPRVGILRVDGRDGQSLAVVVNYACHPVVFGPDNLQVLGRLPSAMAGGRRTGVRRGNRLSLPARSRRRHQPVLRQDGAQGRRRKADASKRGREARATKPSASPNRSSPKPPEHPSCSSLSTRGGFSCATIPRNCSPAVKAQVQARGRRALPQLPRDAARLPGDDPRDQSRDRLDRHAGRAFRRIRPRLPRPLAGRAFHSSPATPTAITAISPRSARRSAAVTVPKASWPAPKSAPAKRCSTWGSSASTRCSASSSRPRDAEPFAARSKERPHDVLAHRAPDPPQLHLPASGVPFAPSLIATVVWNIQGPRRKTRNRRVFCSVRPSRG